MSTSINESTEISWEEIIFPVLIETIEEMKVEDPKLCMEPRVELQAAVISLKHTFYI